MTQRRGGERKPGRPGGCGCLVLGLASGVGLLPAVLAILIGLSAWPPAAKPLAVLTAPLADGLRQVAAALDGARVDGPDGPVRTMVEAPAGGAVSPPAVAEAEEMPEAGGRVGTLVVEGVRVEYRVVRTARTGGLQLTGTVENTGARTLRGLELELSHDLPDTPAPKRVEILTPGRSDPLPPGGRVRFALQPGGAPPGWRPGTVRVQVGRQDRAGR